MSREVKLEIEFLPHNAGAINYGGVKFPEGNNISNPSAINTASGGGKPFILGVSKLGEGDRLWDTRVPYNGFMGVQRNFGQDNSFEIDEQGNATQPPTFAITGEAIERLVITFDSTAKQWATRLMVNGVPFDNNSEIFIWESMGPVDTVEIQILNWNLPLYPVRITSILIGLTKVYDKRQLTKLSAGSESTNNPQRYFAGTMSQYATVHVQDIDKGLMDFADIKLLVEDLETKMFFGDSKLGKMRTENFNYLFGSLEMRARLKDIILQLNNAWFEGVTVDENNTGFSIWQMFTTAIRQATGEELKISPEVQDHLERISFPDGYLEPGNLRERMDGFLVLLRMKIYLDASGELWGLII